MPKFKYNIINSSGEEEPWTGVFEDQERADKWYSTHGRYWENLGKKLVRHEVKEQESESQLLTL